MTQPIAPEDTRKRRDTAHDAFIRWQQYTLTHFGHTVNLVLALSTAGLGFAVNLIVDQRITPASSRHCTFLGSTFLLVAAVAAGLLANYLRLLNFRNTARVARGREMQARADSGEILTAKQQAQAQDRNRHRATADCLGKVTWWLLCFQSGSFFLGIFLMASTIWRFYR